MPTTTPTDTTVSWSQPQFSVDVTPVDVTLEFNAAGAGPIGPMGPAGPPGVGVVGPSGPPGNQGIAGSPGTAATIAVGATATGAAGTPASVSNSGTANAAVFNFQIPQGLQGNPGAVGATGPAGPPGGASAYTTLTAGFTMPAVNSTAVASVANASGFNIGNIVYIAPIGYLNITAIGTNQLTLQNLGYTVNQAPGSNAPSGNTVTGVGPQGPPGNVGGPGPAGSAATISVGTTTTGSPGTPASVTNAGNSSAAVFNFQIPAGQTGAVGGIGPQGPPGPAGTGDMTKAVYDVNNDNIVDHAALADTATTATNATTAATASAAPWTGITGKPTTFPPSTHAATHNLGGSDAVAPDWTQVQNKPVSYPVDWSTVTGKPAAYPPTPHAASHVTSGSDVIPSASATAAGLLAQLSGLSSDYVGGDNACHNLAAAVAALLVPTGSVLDFAGSSAPSGFVLCNGASYPTTGAMANLFAVIAYTYGGSGANFNVPDCRGVATIGAGQGTGLTNRALAAKGGEEKHSLSSAEEAPHNHTIPPHSHQFETYYNGAWNADNLLAYQSALSAGTAWITVSQPGSGSIAPSATLTTDNNTGSGSGHNNMQPFIALNKIIKT